ncbi:IPExxxVDY family protein [Maribacter aestuarii]|uniref:IPExxxVDY family protein n=1 Tax=Maribacter aestuarii TaxID=1130723 RepID=UPI0025A4EABE|nr:IPExxxVDY family protein [Maribacter aestuarii]
MAAVYKIESDFYEDSFILIALHSTLEDYAIIYFLNQSLQANFKRTKEDFDLAEGSSFSVYEWEDNYNDRFWKLIANRSSKRTVLANNDLFLNDHTYIKPRLIPELKEVDYFLRIEHDSNISQEEIIKKILTAPKIMAAYQVETNKLKSKNNLIF